MTRQETALESKFPPYKFKIVDGEGLTTKATTGVHKNAIILGPRSKLNFTNFRKLFFRFLTNVLNFVPSFQ